MLKWLDLAFAWKTASRRRRRRVDRRLRAEVAVARIEPSPGLRRRTISALNDACHACHASRAEGGRGLSSRSAYAVAFVALIVLCAVAVRLGVTPEAVQEPATDPPATLVLFDTTAFDTLIRAQLQEFEGPWESSSLRTEAKLIATDARNAAEFFLAALPVPTTWGLARPGG